MANLIVEINRVNYVRVGFGEAEIRQEAFKALEQTFDENGNLLKEIRFTPDGEVEETTESVFENGRQTSTSIFDGTGELIMKTDNVYEGDRLLKQVKTYGYGSGEEIVHEEIVQMEYEDERLYREVVCDDEGERLQKEYGYDGRFCMEMKEYNEDGELTFHYHYTYDASGRLVQVVRDEVLAKDRRTFVYAYDEAGNRAKELVYNYKEELIAKKYIRFDEQKRILEEEVEDLDHYVKNVYEYDGDLLKKISVENKDSEVQSWTEMDYDEEQRLLNSAQYITDEVDPGKYRLLSEENRSYGTESSTGK